MRRLQSVLKGSVYGVLGNHDTILMVPGLEEMGIHVLLNEYEPITRGADTIYLAGIDDAHYYRMDNLEKAVGKIPQGEFTILLSHTPGIYRQAARAGFDLLLSGHTHGGQICLAARSPSLSVLFSPDIWAQALGGITQWQVIRRSALDHLWFPCASIAFRKLRFIIWNAIDSEALNKNSVRKNNLSS